MSAPLGAHPGWRVQGLVEVLDLRHQEVPIVTVSKLRRRLYYGARVLGDVEAVQQAVRTGSVKPLGRRLVRKALWRGFGRAMRKGGL